MLRPSMSQILKPGESYYEFVVAVARAPNMPGSSRMTCTGSASTGTKGASTPPVPPALTARAFAAIFTPRR